MLQRSEHSPAATTWWRQGILDLVDGVANWRLCHLIGLAEIRRRYSRSKLGQFWLTLSTALTVAALGFVWATLWKAPVAELLPYVAVSLICWNMITGVLTEATTVFTATGHMFLNQGMSFSTAIYAIIYRQIVIFLHNIPVIIGVALLFGFHVRTEHLLVVPGFLLLLTSLTWMSYLIAIACVRFRDLTQVVQNLMMLAFFVTPVIWRPMQLPPDKHYLLMFNPFAVLLEVVRDPLLGTSPPVFVWATAAAIAIGGFLLAIPIIGYCRRRIIYWI